MLKVMGAPLAPELLDTCHFIPQPENAYDTLTALTNADVVVVFASEGATFEFGYVFSLSLACVVWGAKPPEIILCGTRQHKYHHLGVRQFDTWPEVKSYLIERSNAQAQERARTN